MIERAVVVGAGIAGCAAAAALRLEGVEVTVLEAGQGPLRSFRGELVHPVGRRALADLGFGDVVARLGAVECAGGEQPAAGGEGAGEGGESESGIIITE